MSLTLESHLLADRGDEAVQDPANTYFEAVLCANISPLLEYGTRQSVHASMLLSGQGPLQKVHYGVDSA
jgi:hypothetical protein